MPYITSWDPLFINKYTSIHISTAMNASISIRTNHMSMDWSDFPSCWFFTCDGDIGNVARVIRVPPIKPPKWEKLSYLAKFSMLCACCLAQIGLPWKQSNSQREGCSNSVSKIYETVAKSQITKINDDTKRNPGWTDYCVPIPDEIHTQKCHHAHKRDRATRAD